MRKEGREPGKDGARGCRKTMTGTHHKTRVTSDAGPIYGPRFLLTTKSVFLSNSRLSLFFALSV